MSTSQAPGIKVLKPYEPLVVELTRLLDAISCDDEAFVCDYNLYLPEAIGGIKAILRILPQMPFEQDIDRMKAMIRLNDLLSHPNLTVGLAESLGETIRKIEKPLSLPSG